MDTRTSFRNAVQDAQAFNTDKVDRRPGFISSVGRMGKSQKRDVRALPAIDNARRGPVADVSRLMAEGPPQPLSRLEMHWKSSTGYSQS